MEIGDRLEFELVKSENPCSCNGCDVWPADCFFICEHCGENVFKLLPKQNRITFENVSSNIICSQITGNKQLLDLTLKITPENSELCDIAYGKTGKLKATVEVIE